MVKASDYNAGDLGWEDPLEKEMAVHSSIVAWKIPWTEEPGRLQSMGSQRVGHDWATSLSLSPQKHSHSSLLKMLILKFLAVLLSEIRKFTYPSKIIKASV